MEGEKKRVGGGRVVLVYMHTALVGPVASPWGCWVTRGSWVVGTKMAMVEILKLLKKMQSKLGPKYR